MAIGDPQDDDGAYHGGVKQGLLGLQLPRSSRANGFYGTQLPLAPGIQQVQYMYPRQDARHEQYSAEQDIPRPSDSISPAFHGLGFNDGQNSIRASSNRRQCQHTVTLSIHGLENPMTAEIEWQSSNAISSEQRARLDRHIREGVYNIVGRENGNFEAHSRPETTITNASRRTSRSPDERGSSSSYRCMSQGVHKRQAEQQLSRNNSPDDFDDSEFMPIVPMQQIRLGDEEAVRQCYDVTLRNVQQLALKQILKEWIKEIEPKKQKNCPYKKGIRPKWWPEAAQYKEPDHIKLDDRIHLAIGIIRHAQDPNELNGEGLGKLEKSVGKQELLFDTDPREKQAYRKNLLESLFTLARAEQQVKNDERDATDFISLPTVRKFERPSKKRKKSAAKKKQSLKNGDGKTSSIEATFDCPLHSTEAVESEHGLLKPEALRSTSHEGGPTTAPTTPTWPRHSAHDSDVYFPHNDSSARAHVQHMMPYAQQCDPSAPILSRYPSFEGATIDVPNSSPGSQYPSSATSNSSMHMLFPDSTQPVSIGYQPLMHGLPLQDHGNEIMSEIALSNQGRPQITAFTAVTERDDNRWSSTPASYMPQQQHVFATADFYG